MQLSDILGTLKINPAEYPDREITGVTCSTDNVRLGSLFAAVRGVKTDGHRFLGLAAEKGAVAAIGDEEIARIPPELVYIRCENAEKAYALACAAVCKNPQRRLLMAGVTGTNGKTTVTSMLRSIFVAAGIGCGLIGTVETIAGGRRRAAERTTPAAEELFPLLGEMASSGDRCCVMEVSSHALVRNRVHGIRFKAGVMTNVTRDHLDFHKTMQAYAEAKASLMEQSETGVINADDGFSALFKEKAERYVTYSAEGKADFRAENIKYSPEGITFSSPAGEIKLPPGGKFSVYNALAAMAAASVMGLEDKHIRAGLEMFQGVRGRMELLKTKGGYKVYIDYAHTPDGLENVLTALRQFAPKRIITVFGCGGDRDREKRPLMGEVSARLSDFTVVTSDNPRTEAPEDIIADILKGIKTFRFAAVTDRREAIRFALRMAADGDIILLAGKGHETYQAVGDEKIPMDEREIVREAEAEK